MLEASRFESEIERAAADFRALSQAECWKAMQCWREVFASAYHQAKGKWKLGHYDWHIFSFGFVRALNGDKAFEVYRTQPPAAGYLVPQENASPPGYWCNFTHWPDLRSLELDFIVWPEDLSWTMAFTHEASWNLGPFFSRREWLP